MKLLLLIFLFFSSIYSYKILVWTSVIGRSHLDFASSCVDKLVDHGHTVDMVVARMNTLVKNNGSTKARRFIDFTFRDESPWLKAAHLRDPFGEEDGGPGVLAFFHEVTALLCEDVLKDDRILDFIKEEKYDLVLTTSYDYCSLAMFHAAGLDNIASISPTPLMTNQAYLNGLPTPPGYVVDILQVHLDHLELTFRERMGNLMRHIHYEMIGYPTIIKRMNRVVRSRFGASFPSVDHLATKINVMFVNTNEILEEPRPISHKIKYIGGINMKKPKPINKKFDEILSHSKKGNVIFSFGTQVPSSMIPLSTRKAFIAAFRRFPNYNFIWKYDGAENDKDLFGNVTNVKPIEWLPQTDLLQDPRVVAFISHVGLNSLLEAAYAGVPIIAMPLFADQVWNGNIVKKHGIAVVLKKTEVTEDSVYNALSNVLENEKMKKQSLKIAQMLKKKPENIEEQFIKWVEYAAEFKDLHYHFNLQGAYMSGIVANGLDVGAVLLVGVLILVFFSLYAIKRIVLFMASRISVVPVEKKIQ